MVTVGNHCRAVGTCCRTTVGLSGSVGLLSGVTVGLSDRGSGIDERHHERRRQRERQLQRERWRQHAHRQQYEQWWRHELRLQHEHRRQRGRKQQRLFFNISDISGQVAQGW